MSDSKKSQKKTLLERAGGESFVDMLLDSFLDEVLRTPKLFPFFNVAPVETIKAHQNKFFRLLFGPEKNKPNQEYVFDYMLKAHARLFREAGLNGSHFDLVTACLVRSLNFFHVGSDIVNEIVSILVPLRVAFIYGSEIATKEKAMEVEEFKNLPQCSARTIATDIPLTLPLPLRNEVPRWLKMEMSKVTKITTLRAWTSNLSDRCIALGDIALADTMMDMRYYQLEPYLNTLVQLAFVPDGIDDTSIEKILRTIRFPRGCNEDPLSRTLFDRLVIQFCNTCNDFNVTEDDTKVLNQKLLIHSTLFPNVNPSPFHGLSNPQRALAQDKKQLQCETSVLDEASKDYESKSSTISSTGVSTKSCNRKRRILKWFDKCVRYRKKATI
jgi:truncated hemoglobin YjbI